MPSGTVRHTPYKAHDPDQRNRKDMLSRSDAAHVWKNLQIIMKARGLTFEVAGDEIGCPPGTLKNIKDGRLSSELMRKIKKWATK